MIKPKKKILFTTSLILITSLTLLACKKSVLTTQDTGAQTVTKTDINTSESVKEYSNKHTSENYEEQPKEDVKQYPMIFDNYGREVVVSAMPQKVLTLGPNCTELFVALGLTDYIVGNSLKNHSRGPLPEYAEEFANIP